MRVHINAASYNLLRSYATDMNPRMKLKCERCNGPAEAEMVPDEWTDNPATFTATIRCDKGCPTDYLRQIPREKAFEMTKQSYDGSTGQWTRLPSQH